MIGNINTGLNFLDRLAGIYAGGPHPDVIQNLARLVVNNLPQITIMTAQVGPQPPARHAGLTLANVEFRVERMEEMMFEIRGLVDPIFQAINHMRIVDAECMLDEVDDKYEAIRRLALSVGVYDRGVQTAESIALALQAQAIINEVDEVVDAIQARLAELEDG